MLFQLDLSGGSPAGVIAQFWSGTPEDDRERPFAERLVHGVAGRQSELDRWIVASAENWRLEHSTATTQRAPCWSSPSGKNDVSGNWSPTTSSDSASR